ncbi:hypothetical protein [Polyangium sp. y55x31]|uniref:hypothetical protein n=1 Tax=Polyangium sp. y55x31 TaxID=3042688 RepID=UPI0024827BF3|nr:hypothetical protein [Polyangium sp. y55x31]MDI1477931.1 hypothetical protein [Polyangium sp. y55x31]
MLTFVRRIAPLFLVATTAACAEPPAPCLVSSMLYFARYDVVSQTGGCIPRLGEDVGLEVYPGTNGGPQTIALQSQSLKSLWFEANFNGTDLGDGRPFALGDFPETAGEDGICRAGDLAPAEIELPPTQVFDDLGNVVSIGGGRIRETWWNLAMYVAPDVPGVRFAAELEVEDLKQGCSVTYKVAALSPSSYCGEFSDFSDEPNDALCSPAPSQTFSGLHSGSGIDPRIATHCDPVTLRCVLDGGPLDPL